MVTLGLDKTASLLWWYIVSSKKPMWTWPRHIVLQKGVIVYPGSQIHYEMKIPSICGSSNGYGRKLEENMVMDNASEHVILRISYLVGLFIFKVIREIQKRGNNSFKYFKRVHSNLVESWFHYFDKYIYIMFLRKSHCFLYGGFKLLYYRMLV